MAELAKASIVQLTGAPNPTPIEETKVQVQFNPTTMRLQMTNNIEGGKARPRQVQQYTGSGSTSLSLDLVFDSADSLSNVRDKTLKVVKFVMPSKQSKEAPPRIRFEWGTFRFDGVMNSITEDIDLFSPEGIPLRSKLTIEIKEQDAKFEALEAGAGAKQGSAATSPGGSLISGSQGGGPTDRTAGAQAGESVADFAVRMGLDPAAWRGIAAGISASAGNPLSLPGGLQVDFNSNLSAGAGVGAQVGLGTGGSLDAAAAAGLQLSGSGTQASASAGLALAAAGGVSAATQTVAVARTESAAAEARAAFDVPPPAAPSGSDAMRARTLGVASVPSGTAAVMAGRSGGPIDPSTAAAPPDRAPLRRSSAASPGAAPAVSAPAPALSDPRATSFGFGVPLRPRIAGAAEDRPGATGWVRVGTRPRSEQTPETPDPTVAPWRALIRPRKDRLAANTTPASGTAGPGCGCGGAG